MIWTCWSLNLKQQSLHLKWLRAWKSSLRIKPS